MLLPDIYWHQTSNINISKALIKTLSKKNKQKKNMEGFISICGVLFHCWVWKHSLCAEHSLEQRSAGRDQLCAAQWTRAASITWCRQQGAEQLRYANEMTETLSIEHLPPNSCSPLRFALVLQCISFALDSAPSHPLSSISGYTSSNQALIPWVKPGQCLSSSLWNADTVSKVSGPLLNYSTPEEKKKKCGVITRQHHHEGAER